MALYNLFPSKIFCVTLSSSGIVLRHRRRKRHAIIFVQSCGWSSFFLLKKILILQLNFDDNRNLIMTIIITCFGKILYNLLRTRDKQKTKNQKTHSKSC